MPDIRLPYPINPSNADRVIALLDRTHLSFIVDHPVVARQWSDAMTRAGKQVDVLVKVDVGFHRCGIDPDSRDAVTIIRGVAALPGCAPGPAVARRPDLPRALGRRAAGDGGGGGADDERSGRALPKGRRADRRGQRGRDAAGAIFDPAGRVHRIPARQLRVLRSHAGGAGRRDASTIARSRCWRRW